APPHRSSRNGRRQPREPPVPPPPRPPRPAPRRRRRAHCLHAVPACPRTRACTHRVALPRHFHEIFLSVPAPCPPRRGSPAVIPWQRSADGASAPPLKVS